MLPEAHDEFEPLLLGSYLTYMATNVTENQAPKSKDINPPMKLTMKTCPKFLAMSIAVWSMTTLKGMRGIQLMKQMILNILKSAKTTPAE